MYDKTNQDLKKEGSMGWTIGKARTPGNDKESITIQGHRGRVIEKMIRCGKEGCTNCPHGPYKYLVYREGNKVRTKYLGKV